MYYTPRLHGTACGFYGSKGYCALLFNGTQEKMLKSKDTVETNVMPEATGNILWSAILELFVNKQK